MTDSTQTSRDESQSWFREEYERAKARNALIPPHARMIITNPCLAGDHSRCGCER